MGQVAIIDTGAGNLRSVERALAQVGSSPVVTSNPEIIRAADRVVVPGQGAFGHFVRALQEQGLQQALCEFLATGRPYLGICLGLQVLFESSEEQGPVAGLAILPGHTVRFRPSDRAQKVPHMGWNSVQRQRSDPMLAGIPDQSYFYFVHSYYVAPTDPSTVVLTCDYGIPFAAAVRKDNIFACQFHPRKANIWASNCSKTL